MSTPILLENLDLLPIYHHIRLGIWLEWSYPKASIHLKISGCPASPLIQSFLFPFLSLSLSLSLPSFPLPSLPFPSLVPLPRAAPPPKPVRGSGECCKLPQWGLGQSPSRQTIWCISEPKKNSSVLCIFLYRHHRPILSFSYCVWKRLNWISHFFTTSMH